MSKHGKSLSRAQRDILKQNGIDDCTNWYYIKQETIDIGGSKRAAINRDKQIVMIVQNSETGETRRIPI